MHLVLVHRHSEYPEPASADLHRFAVANSPVAEMVFAAMTHNYLPMDGKDMVIAVPEEWAAENSEHNHEIITYSRNLSIPLWQSKKNGWLIVSDGRFITSVNGRAIMKLLNCCDGDIITIDVNPALSGYREKTRFTTSGFLAGVRRTYGDSVLPQQMPRKWPHHVFVKNDVAKDILAGDILPVSFDQFADRCRDLRLRWHSFIISGRVIDLATGAGLLNLVQSSRIEPSIADVFNGSLKHADRISGNARIFGKVFCGENIFIGDNATIIGPAIICDDVKIGSSSVIKNALIGPHVSIENGAFVHDCVITGRQQSDREFLINATSCTFVCSRCQNG